MRENTLESSACGLEPGRHQVVFDSALEMSEDARLVETSLWQGETGDGHGKGLYICHLEA